MSCAALSPEAQTGPCEVLFSGCGTPSGSCRASMHRGPGPSAEAGGGSPDQGPCSGRQMLAGGKRPPSLSSEHWWGLGRGQEWGLGTLCCQPPGGDFIGLPAPTCGHAFLGRRGLL